MTGWALDKVTCFVNFESNLEYFTNSQLIYLKDLVNAVKNLFPKIIEMQFKGGLKETFKSFYLLNREKVKTSVTMETAFEGKL